MKHWVWLIRSEGDNNKSKDSKDEPVLGDHQLVHVLEHSWDVVCPQLCLIWSLDHKRVQSSRMGPLEATLSSYKRPLLSL